MDVLGAYLHVGTVAMAIELGRVRGTRDLTFRYVPMNNLVWNRKP